MGESNDQEQLWSDEETAAYRKWLFSGPEEDLDTSSEDWLSDLQERAFHGGFLAGEQQQTPEYQAACGSWDCRAPECKPNGTS